MEINKWVKDANARLEKINKMYKDSTSYGYKYGQFDGARSQFNKPNFELGTIRSVFTEGNTILVLAEKLDKDSVHGIPQYFGIDPDFIENYGWKEMYFPLSNLHLGVGLVDPRQLIGHTVKVTLINKVIQEVEYVGSLTNLADTGSGVSYFMLRAARALIGNLVPLNDEAPTVKEALKALGITQEVIDGLYKYDIKDFIGKVVNVDTDAKMYQETATPPEGVVTVKEPTPSWVSNKEEGDMKTKNCHIPLKMFSAKG